MTAAIQSDITARKLQDRSLLAHIKIDSLERRIAALRAELSDWRDVLLACDMALDGPDAPLPTASESTSTAGMA